MSAALTEPMSPDGAATGAALPRTVVLIGNPNTGKSTLFNALSGIPVRIANFPGCTVEHKVGRFEIGAQAIDLVDLPGTYSLSARSPDEVVAVDVLLGRQPEVGQPHAVLCIADAANLERNLHLLTQVQELGLPTVLCLNMWDVSTARGVQIDVATLSARLGLPVVPISAQAGTGLDDLQTTLLATVLGQGPAEQASPILPAAFGTEVRALTEWLTQHGHQASAGSVGRALLDVGGEMERRARSEWSGEGVARLVEARKRLAASGFKAPFDEPRVRYEWIRRQLAGVIKQPAGDQPTRFTDRIDQILTHRVWGLAVFVAVMMLVFQSIFTWAEPMMQAVEYMQGAAADLVSQVLVPGTLRSLLVDALVAGVGAVLVFIPQIALLFLFIGLLEDCGYMARAAYLMDRLMTRVGLSGKSFLPLMSSFACAIPGIMATRTIENRRDRLLTILIAPLMSCSARLPVYALMIATFIPTDGPLGAWLPVLVLLIMYSLGAIVAVPMAWLLRKTLVRGETPPFVMELPEYQWPSFRVAASRVYEQVWHFLGEAGTMIFATSVLVWAAGYFPGDHRQENALQRQLEDRERQLANEATPGDEASGLPVPMDSGAPARAENAAAAADTSTSDVAAAPGPAGTNGGAVAVDGAVDNGGAETDQSADAEDVAESEDPELARLRDEINAERGRLLQYSFLGRAGRRVEPVVRPLGWDWRIGMAAIASFPAREVVIATMGTIFSLGGDVDEENPTLKSTLKSATWPDGRPLFDVPVAISMMVFFALCAQCGATLAVIHRETKHWFWPVWAFVSMTGVAYVAAALAYAGTRWLLAL